MNGFRALASSLLVSAAVLVSVPAQAMDVQVYERMSRNDQDNYTGVMIAGAEHVLTDAGMADAAAKVEKLFTAREPGDENTLGMVEFELNLASVDKADADYLVKNPNAKPLQVEIAMIVTLKNNGIVLPKSFIHVGDGFQPKDALSGAPQTFSVKQK